MVKIRFKASPWRRVAVALGLSVGLVAGAASPASATVFYQGTQWNGGHNGYTRTGNAGTTKLYHEAINAERAWGSPEVCIEHWVNIDPWSVPPFHEHRTPDIMVTCRQGNFGYGNLPINKQSTNEHYDHTFWTDTDQVVCVVSPPNFTRTMGGNCQGQDIDINYHSGKSYFTMRYGVSGPDKPQYIIGNLETLWNGHTMWPGDMLVSLNGYFRLIMQGDGNLVLYRQGVGVCWASGTNSAPDGSRLVMQGDGNLVIYTPQNVPVWSTGTNGWGSNVVLRTDEGGKAAVWLAGNIKLWETNNGPC